MLDERNINLSTELIELRPLTVEYVQEFYQAGAFPELWRWSLPNKCQSIETAKQWLEFSQDKKIQGEHYPFAIFDKKSNALVGSTRFCSINSENRSIEIGFTFITPSFQRSHINTHTKYCLLKYAFEKLNVIRVEFKAHVDNVKSRNAIERIGASFEGILRNQRILFDGTYRNTALFSIICSEWRQVKKQLEDKMMKDY